ncbi:hypothetical protein RIF29_07791 [Crotalaria pallida]|uniref:Uncharacterized protein n=1 Tax=Crotalaria pallida TaxID=3830 RepID=A0AAN9PC50_CROPI
MANNSSIPLWVKIINTGCASAAVTREGLLRGLISNSGAVTTFIIMFMHLFSGFNFGLGFVGYLHHRLQLIRIGNEDLMRGANCTCLDSENAPGITTLIGAVVGHYAYSCSVSAHMDDNFHPRTGSSLVIHTARTRSMRSRITAENLGYALKSSIHLGIMFTHLSFMGSLCDSDKTIAKQLLIIPGAALSGVCGLISHDILRSILHRLNLNWPKAADFIADIF